MNDFRITVEIWDTNKGPSLGYVKWAVKLWNDDLERYVTIAESKHPVTLDVAIKEANRHFNYCWVEQWPGVYQPPDDDDDPPTKQHIPDRGIWDPR